MADEQQRHMRGFRRQRQAAARRQVIGFRLTPDFDEDGGQRRAARRLKPGLQRGERRRSSHQREAGRRKAKTEKPWRIDMPCLALRQFMPHPDEGGRTLVFRQALLAQRANGKTGGRRTIDMRCRIKLMHAGPGEKPHRLHSRRRPATGGSSATEARGLDKAGDHEVCSCFVLLNKRNSGGRVKGRRMGCR